MLPPSDPTTARVMIAAADCAARVDPYIADSPRCTRSPHDAHSHPPPARHAAGTEGGGGAPGAVQRG